MHERHDPPPDRRDAANRGLDGRHGEALTRIEYLDDLVEREADAPAPRANEQIPAPRIPHRRAIRVSSWPMRPAIWPSGSTWSAPPACAAALGMPKIVALPRSCAMPTPPAS